MHQMSPHVTLVQYLRTQVSFFIQTEKRLVELREEVEERFPGNPEFL